MDKIAQKVALKFAAMFNVGDIVLYGKYKNKKGKLVAFGKNDKGQPTIEVEPIPKGRKKNKMMGLYKIWTTPKAEADAAKAQAKAEAEEKAKKEKMAALKLDPELQKFADLLAKGLSDRKILLAMGITLNEAHALANKLREALGITAMDNLRKTLQMRHADLHQRVASRYIKAHGIPVGHHYDQGDVRIHRFRDHFRVWDLTNAGKRGKKVKVLVIEPTYQYKGNPEEWMENMAKALPDYDTIGRIRAYISDLLQDYPGEIRITESEERGVDVNPGGTMVLKLKTNTGLEIKADPMDFMLVSKFPLVDPKTRQPNGLFQDTLYSPSGKDDAKVFYNWLMANLAEANRMDISGFRELWDSLKVRWKSFTVHRGP